MSVKKFKFVSPGIFINEIDNSQLTKQGADVGPVIIGRTLRGPAMRPVQIQSFADFIETFGEPQAGGVGGDVWRDGNRLGPTYAAYAAQAYLRSASPITFVRLLGESHPDASSSSIRAGWEISQSSSATWAGSADGATGAYGLFIANGGAEGARSKGSIEFNSVTSADAGGTVAVTAATHAAVTYTEASGQFPAARFEMLGAFAGGEAVELKYTHQDGTVTLITVGNGASNTVNVVAEGDTTVLANLVKTYINDNSPSDGLKAISDGALVTLYEETRQGGGAVPSGGLDVSGTAGKVTDTADGAFPAFSIAHADFITPRPGSYPQETGALVISIAGACDTAGISTLAFSSSPSVDNALAAQVAAKTDTNFTSAVDSSDSSKVIFTDADTGTQGDAGTVGGTMVGARVVATNFSGGSSANYEMDAALAAILYCKKGAVSLVGRAANESAAPADGKFVDGINVWVKSDGAQNQFKLRARNTREGAQSSRLNSEDISFNFNENSRIYIRNVLNTNPTLTNEFLMPAGDTAKLKSYFLGQTFEGHLAEVQGAFVNADGSKGLNTSAGGQFACLVPLKDASSCETDMQAAKSPWIISQHNGEPQAMNLDPSTAVGAAFHSTKSGHASSLQSVGVEKLFRFCSLYSGEWERKHLKISIQDIKAPTDSFNPYGTFSVVIRKSEDADSAPVVVERYSGCSLNPASPDFIARKIGDMESRWDDAERRYVSYGLYENQSRFIRVEMAASVASGTADPRLVPFGFYGPARRSSLLFVTEADSEPNAVTTISGVGSSDVLIANATATIDEANHTGLKLVNLASRGDTLNTTDIAGDVNGNLIGSGEQFDKLAVGINTPGTSTTADADETSSWSVTMRFPKPRLRKSTLDSTLSSPRDAYFGVTSNKYGSSSVYDNSWSDLLGYGARGVVAQGTGLSHDPAAPAGTTGVNEYSFIFSLDDIKYATPTKLDSGVPVDPNRMETPPTDFEWVPGSHARNYGADGLGAGKLVPDGVGTDATACSITAYSGVEGATTAEQSVRERGFEAILDKGIDRFTVPLVGGHDGVDIFEIEPFGYHNLLSTASNLAETGNSVMDHYALNSMKKAIDTVADPEVVEMNILTIPGATHPAITQHAVTVCENRGDALAIIDLDGDYMPPHLDGQDEAARQPVVQTAITKLRQRQLNSSYGCAFYPWVQVSDTMSGRTLWAPSSVAALGVMASSARQSELWFAPAGFTRGGLTDGAAGIPVTNVKLRLNSKERDKLYEANINPIAQFPAEGIVIFGQKTLQLTPSALDRINVRRLMIFLKKQISRMAATVLFDQNVRTTWARFVSQADPFLASVKGRFGLTEYKIILDETTTTPELIDRNIMYAKILLKPAKAIEYIAIDFVITDSGASFDD